MKRKKPLGGNAKNTTETRIHAKESRETRKEKEKSIISHLHSLEISLFRIFCTKKNFIFYREKRKLYFTSNKNIFLKLYYKCLCALKIN